MVRSGGALVGIAHSEISSLTSTVVEAGGSDKMETVLGRACCHCHEDDEALCMPPLLIGTDLAAATDLRITCSV